MTWLKENKFLSGFFGVLAVAAVVMLVLMFSAKGRYETALDSYREQVLQLNKLKGNEPFPEQRSLKLMGEQNKQYQAAIAALQKDLSGIEIPLEPVTEAKFQEDLKQAVARVTAKAAEKGTGLPARFYLGFDTYQSQPPRKEAAPYLERELKAVEWVLMQMIDAHVASIDEFKRTPLPEETVAKPAKPERPEKVVEKVTKPALTKQPFEITFTAEHTVFRNVLNSIVASKVQFYIPRKLEVKNEKQSGPIVAAAIAPPPPDPTATTPATTAPVAGGATSAQPPAVSPVAPPPEDLRFIVGEERVQVVLGLEIVNFPAVVAK